MLDIGTICLFVVVLLLARIYRTGRRPKHMPPGPGTWPFIGNLDIIYSSNRFHVTSQELGRKYNGMFSIQYGAYPGIIITDFRLAREAFVEMGDIYSDRATHTAFSQRTSPTKDKGLISQSGETWKRLKRLTMASMRDFGVGKASIEHKIQEEVAEVIAHIDQQQGAFFAFDNLFNLAVTNVICAVLFDKRYAYDDPVYLKQLDYFNNIIRESGFRNIFQFLPLWTLIFMPILQPGTRSMLTQADHVRRWLRENIQEHRDSFDPANPRDFVDLYLQAERSEEGLYSDKQMFGTIFELLGAGSETTSTTLLWAVVFLTRHPHVQHKCRQEIKRVVGERQVRYADRSSMPYLEATLCEILRRGNTVPIVIPHRTNESSRLGGYSIPRDTIVSISMYAIHMDPAHWENPHEFKPERFLDDDENLVKPEAFMPFGLGRRACLGESLAKMELWLFLAELLHRFEWRAQTPAQLPWPETTDFAITLIPDRFYVSATRID